jgi:hypothetical protein
MANGEGRAAPAYQEYASEMLAKRPFRLMTASARGVFYTMRLELWANETLPAAPGALAAILGIDAGEVAAALPTVMPFFTSENGEIQSPELDRYRTHLEARRLKLSDGGRAGAAITNAERRKPNRRKNGSTQRIPETAAISPATPSATPSASSRPLSTVQRSKAKQDPPLEKGLSPADPWIADYDAAQSVEAAADDYQRASRG